ncbi:MAG TPA: hypothetical protein VJZ01_08555 [Lachnospiraceae bacterium]|jgi:hypothetical protein|nr:hypothetical protein [Lachnospiraceae bacterium]
MKKIRKGQYGYINYQKKVEVLKTVCLFACAFFILAIGFYSTGTKSNLLTVIAILGMLPASKSAVGMIMFLRFKTGERSIYDETIQAAKGLPMNYDLVLTTTQKAYQISSAACYANTLCGYVENPKTDCAALEKHISEMLNKNNFKNVTVKFFDDFKAYTNRLTTMNENLTEHEDQTSDEIFALLQAISI